MNPLQRAKLNRNVILTGFTSFCTDVSSEMIYPLLQAFVAVILGAQQILVGPILGIIEGISESTASLGKVFAGYYSDRIANRKTPTIIGYAISALAKAALFLSSVSWLFVLFYRFGDRVGKGIRSAPRDALIAESTPPNTLGKAFGFQRAMDFAGATLGTIVLYFFSLRYLDPLTNTLKSISNFYTIFLISIIPAFLAVLFLFFIKEPQKDPLLQASTKPKPNLNFRSYSKPLQLFFLAQAIFTLGNSSNQFLLLRSMNLGYALSTVILMYMIFNLTSASLSRLFGSLSDRIGRKKLLISGYTLYAIVYAAFGFVSRSSGHLLWVFWILYGVYYALTEGVEKAFVADVAPKESRGTALGYYNTVTGVFLLPASIIAGLLFAVSPHAPFLFSAVASAVAIVLILFFVKTK